MSDKSLDLYDLAVEAAQNGDLPKALEHTEASLMEDSQDGQTWQMYSVLLQAAGREEDAEKAKAKCFELGGDDTDVYMMKASEALAQGKPGAAITHYEDALELDDTRVEIWISYAMVLMEEGYQKDALEASQKAVTEGVDQPEAHYVRGRVLRLSKRPSEAKESYLKAIELGSTNPITYHELGMVYSELGEISLARQCFEKVLEKVPNDPAALTAIDLLDKRSNL